MKTSCNLLTLLISLPLISHCSRLHRKHLLPSHSLLCSRILRSTCPSTNYRIKSKSFYNKCGMPPANDADPSEPVEWGGVSTIQFRKWLPTSVMMIFVCSPVVYVIYMVPQIQCPKVWACFILLLWQIIKLLSSFPVEFSLFWVYLLLTQKLTSWDILNYFKHFS